ncbi:MAG TPA: prolyl oligopeptidase family serine peptidase [Acidobacteriaceae bacterium]|nr:prolyl oligopeptidase family serine peptidase [Acidobacteriaceae bacterium]
MMRVRFVGLSVLLCVSACAAQEVAIRGGNGVKLGAPPVVAVKPVTDTVGGRQVTDNYRWLEDQKAPDTRAYIDAQMAYTASYFAQIEPLKAAMVKRLTELQRVDVVGVPTERHGKFFFSKRLAAENQASIYMREGLHGADVRLIDAGTLSADGNASVGIADLSSDGKLLMYSERHGGADEEMVRAFDVATRKNLGDALPLARYSGFGLTDDGKTLYYALTTKAGGGAIFRHAMGTSADKDVQVFGGSYRGETLGPLDLIGVRISENGRWLVVTVSHGVPATREDILLEDLRAPDPKLEPLVWGVDSRFQLHIAGDAMFVSTDDGAPNSHVLKASFGDPTTKSWPVVIAEGKEPIASVSIAGGKMFVGRLMDVKSETTIYTLGGKKVGAISYPTIGTGSVVRGRADSSTGFYTFSSFTVPPTIFHYDIATGKSDVWAASKAPFDSSKYEVRQVFYTSKDGTRIPMFIAGRKGLAMDGKAPLLMTGYGGFLISETPSFDPKYAWWMEQGGFFALPNLRGGGEYGETWHKAGMFEKKQNVFDDWFAAAEYLLANKYTTRARLAITGRSNGGLLMGASMTQRPDLYGAILCGYPLLDMTRYQKFLVGRWWTTEYGSADNPEQAAYILKYSPYQNVRPGVKYPAIMFLTGDSDTRVAPLHARKMAALMQATVMAEPEAERRPVLLHYDVKAGHSAGVSVTQLVNDTADELAFLWNETGGK